MQTQAAAWAPEVRVTVLVDPRPRPQAKQAGGAQRCLEGRVRACCNAGRFVGKVRREHSGRAVSVMRAPCVGIVLNGIPGDGSRNYDGSLAGKAA
ncbi:hypothetical protein WR25_21039 [Diploscapter pachys]|uniref:Uncharacterized protein n=1 Tax=Diploscapter pachys TaxID=2018661 RepID=A0A2A2KHQ9_9BILA|nr:hypothetical protein WR25_21039 [Diploscapter pachys]